MPPFVRKMEKLVRKGGAVVRLSGWLVGDKGSVTLLH